MQKKDSIDVAALLERLKERDGWLADVALLSGYSRESVKNTLQGKNRINDGILEAVLQILEKRDAQAVRAKALIPDGNN